ECAGSPGARCLRPRAPAWRSPSNRRGRVGVEVSLSAGQRGLVADQHVGGGTAIAAGGEHVLADTATVTGDPRAPELDVMVVCGKRHLPLFRHEVTVEHQQARELRAIALGQPPALARARDAAMIHHTVPLVGFPVNIVAASFSEPRSRTVYGFRPGP